MQLSNNVYGAIQYDRRRLIPGEDIEVAFESRTFLKLVGIGLRINLESSLSVERGTDCLSNRTCDFQASCSTSISSGTGLHTSSKEEKYKPYDRELGSHVGLEEIAIKIEM